MKLQQIINSLPEAYSLEVEKDLIEKVKSLKLSSFTEELADLLGFAICEHYNNLAKVILEKDYKGRKLDMQSLNNSISNQSGEGYSLLHFTAQFGNKEMLLYFLDNEVLISFDKDNLSPLHTLAFGKKLNKQDMEDIITKFEEKHPGLINHKDAHNLSPLHYAAHNDNMPLLEALLNKGAKK